MTLRLRLTLFYTVLVGVILGLTGMALHVFLERSLLHGVDESLEEAANLIRAVTENVDGSPQVLNPEEVATQFSSDQVALLYDARGAVVARLGRVPEEVPRFGSGHTVWQGWRVLTIPLEAGALTVMRNLEDTHETLRRFDVVFVVLGPLVVLAAFGLGYVLAGGALVPVDRLTRSAHDLARRRAWRERLPEPKQRDELWRLAQGTNELLSALHSVIESERRFTADAAHELRTPLTVLQGRLEKGREQTRDPRARAAFDAALEASAALLDLIEKLLALARAEAGQGLPAERVALDEVAFDAAAQLRTTFSAKGLDLELELPHDPVYVRGDPTALTLAVRNLLDNARKFAPSGSVRLRVWQDDREAHLDVTDSGPGIPEAALPHLFERFYQADVTHRQQGSGLGLALVHSIATWHSGRIVAANAPGGATFTLSLPRDSTSPP